MPRSASRPRRRRPFALHKPNGVLTPRVQAVGAEHFGVLAFDCAKARSRYLLADFFGTVLLEPTTVPHTAGDLQAAIDRVRAAAQQHQLAEVVVALERTGEYHRPVQRAFRAAGFDTRLVHPLTVKHYRQPADPQHKTDDTDVAAVFRAVTQGFGLVEPLWSDDDLALQLLRRHRRDLVDKTSALRCQLHEVLNQLMPGYAQCFNNLWESPAAMVLARHTASAAEVLRLDLAGLTTLLRQASVLFRKDTLTKVLAWARQAPPAHPLTDVLRQTLSTLDDDRLHKTQQIFLLERDLARRAVRTPYALLLAIPGINLVSVADLAGELGPMPLYLTANAITGRAGLRPSCYQSDLVNHPNGPLPARGNRRLRAVLLQTADNLVQCNHYFAAKNDLWRRQGKDPRWIRVKVAKIFSRLAFAIVGGRQLFPHPCRQERSYLLGKLLDFHREHHTPPEQMREDLVALAALLPARQRAAEVAPLQEQLDVLSRRRGPQPLADLLSVVLARLTVVQSEPGAEP